MAPARRGSYSNALPESPIMTYKKSPMSRSPRRISHSKDQAGNTLVIGLQISDVLVILRDAIPRYSKDEDLIAMSEELWIRLVARTKTSNSKLSPGDLEEIISLMHGFVDSAPNLPPQRVGAVHTIIGLIREQQNELDCAIESLQKALWIKKISAREEPEEIGIALHRLGIVYGRAGNHSQACCLLENALAKYDAANLHRNHPFVVTATEKMERYQKPSSRLVSGQKDWRSLPTLPLYGTGDDLSSSIEMM